MRWNVLDSGIVIVGEKKHPVVVGLHSESPGESVNIDLCLVPSSHKQESKEAEPVDGQETRSTEATPYAGEVFQETGGSYEEKMHRYLQQRVANEQHRKQRETEKSRGKSRLKMVKEQEDQLRVQRRHTRQKRAQEDIRWKAYRTAHKGMHNKDEDWPSRKAARKQIMITRAEADQLWRTKRKRINEQKQQLGLGRVVNVHIAILVVIDNCTRKCVALPSFLAGKHVTAEMIVQTVRDLLPETLKYLISDNGPQFIAHLFEQMCTQQEFIHVRITPRRPQTNGIAERFVRTVKEMLYEYEWEDETQFVPILQHIFSEYNNRPHQGRELKGLSPNEYEKRLVA
jgi:transposase InsO family protein